MSETTTPEPGEPKTPEKGKGKGKGKEPSGKENIFTKKYGPLSGWVWVLIGGGTLYLIFVINKRKTATSSATTTADTTTAAGTTTDAGTNSDNGGSSGGYYGGGGMPTGSLNPPIPNSGSATGSSPASPLFGVITTVDEQIAENDGIPLSKLFVGAGTPKAGYTRPADLQSDPGLPGEVYIGQAGTGAPPGSTILQGATRTQTDQEVKDYLLSNPIQT